MRPPAPLALACAAIALTVIAARARASNGIDFDIWMRAIDTRSVSVQRHIAAGETDAAAADARELERLYGLTEDWFANDGNAADAVTLSQDGRRLYASIPAAVAAHDFEAAASAARNVAHACNDCHDNYKPFHN